MRVRVAGLQPESIVDGPGIRFAVFLQGCPHRCPGCHNPQTHDPAGGQSMNVAELVAMAMNRPWLSGITITGGEPFYQAAPAAALAAACRERGLHVMLYSGYTFAQLLEQAARHEDVHCLLQSGHLLVDGPYRADLRSENLPYRGSTNQRLLDLPRSLATRSPRDWRQPLHATTFCREEGHVS